MMRMLTLLAGLSLIATLAMAGAEVKKDGDTGPIRVGVEVGAEVITGAAKPSVPAPVSDSGEALSTGARAAGVPVSDPASGEALSAGARTKSK